jgi:glycosyltransferase involved in cell wall biosynthesis
LKRSSLSKERGLFAHQNPKGENKPIKRRANPSIVVAQTKPQVPVRQSPDEQSLPSGLSEESVLTEARIELSQSDAHVHQHLMSAALKASPIGECSCASAVRSRLSILVPSYNHAPYVSAALDSLLTIPVLDKELIIIDDNSKDNSVETIRKWIASNEGAFRSIIFEPLNENRGLCRNLNAMIRKSSGGTLALMASDDQIVGSGVAALVGTLRESKHLAVAGDPEVIDENGNLLFRSAMEASGRNFAGLESSSASLARELVIWWRSPPPMCVFKRSAFCECCGVGKYDESLSYEDRDMTLRLICQNALKFERITHYRYRSRTDVVNRTTSLIYRFQSILGRSNRIPWYNPNKAWTDEIRRQQTTIDARHIHRFKGLAKAYLNLTVMSAMLKAWSAENPVVSPVVRIVRWGLRGVISGIELLHQLTCVANGMRSTKVSESPTAGISSTI